ncbi:MAG: DUF4831 family protein [Lentimicrobiaceae bacterium]|nr:DUF4831 family protein [Lentimicrobiaceae bacterium]
MRNLTRLTLFFVIVLGYSALLPAQTRLKGKKWKEEVQKHQEVTYFLPRHEFIFDFSFLLQEHRPGPYALYAESLLGIRDVIRASQYAYQLTDLEYDSHVLPDEDARYIYKPASAKKETNCLVLSQQQILLYGGSCCGIPDVAISSPPVGPYVGLSQPGHSTARYQVTEGREKPAANPRRAMPDTANAHIEVRPPVQETPADQRQARDIAERIQDLHTSRIKLLSGYQEIPYSMEALQYMDQQMKDVQDTYIRLFTGDTVTRYENIRVTYVPDKEREGEWVPLFRLDPMRGILPVSAVTGDFCRFRWTTADSEGEVMSDSLTSDDSTTLPELDWVFYRIPRYVRVEVMLGNKLLFSQVVAVSQLGEIKALPVEGLTIRFDPGTGVPVQTAIRRP